MTEERALVPVRNEMTLKETMTLGETLATSGFFSDTKSAAQAVVKILAGKELGFGPIASMTGINIIKNQVAVGGNLMAAAVKGDPRYDYRVVKLSDECCELAFYGGGTELGRSMFTLQDAERAEIGRMVAPGASRNMLTRFPRNMLFNRAMSNGVRWYCPDAFNGNAVYTPEELGAEVDDDGHVIEAEYTTAPTPVPTIESEGNGGDSVHWIDKVDKHAKPIRPQFWAWAGQTMGLKNEQVYEALGVEHIHDFTGSMQDAKTKIEEWVGTQAKKDETQQATEELFDVMEAPDVG